MSSSDDGADLSFNAGSSDTTETPSFLSIPYELRRQIYAYVFTPSPALTINASVTINIDEHEVPFPANISGTQTLHFKFWRPTSTLSRSIASLDVIYTNREVYAEALPILLAQLHLHQTFDADLYRPPLTSHQPDLSTHLPSHVLQNLRHVTYHMPFLPPEDSANHRPCRTPFPFALTPNLTRFAVRKPFSLSIDVLYDPAALKRLTRAEYEAMTSLQRLGVWDRTDLIGPRAMLGNVGRFGCGGWISRLVCPEIYGIEGAADRSGLGVPSGCQVTVEAELRLFDGQSWRLTHIETLLVEVGVHEKRVLSRGFLASTEHPPADRQGGIMDVMIPESVFDGPMGPAMVRGELVAGLEPNARRVR